METAGFGLDDSISIHTPTKGVTGNMLRVLKGNQISIHTPTKGVTVFRLAL